MTAPAPTGPAIPRRAALAMVAAAAAAPALGQEAPLAARGYALGNLVYGADDAPLTVYEYASLSCGACGAFHTRHWPAIKRDFVDTGQVRFVVQDAYRNNVDLWASMMARCGGAEAHSGLMDMLLTRQNEWVSGPAADNLLRLGRLAGLSNERVNQCISDVDLRDALVELYTDNIAERRFEATPTFHIDGRRYEGVLTYAEFSDIVEAALN